MSKRAKKRLQLVTVDGKSAGAIHHVGNQGWTLCGANRKRTTSKWQSLGSGTVTCQTCRKRHT